MSDQLIGRTIGNYRIDSVLGFGATGTVYRAHDSLLTRDVAIKILDPALEQAEDFLRRFRTEAKALARLQNPSIVSVYSLQETELGTCIIMEFVDGETLARRLRDGARLSVGEAKKVFIQLLHALSHAHAAGIIHRDIKPYNIMLTPSGVPKILDFGLAKIRQSSTSTMTVGTEGTLYYMSPEQVKSISNVDHRGDIYSIGMTLYEAVNGTLPFNMKDDDFTVRRAIVEGRIPPPSGAIVPASLVRVIMRALSLNPGDRYQSADEMAKDLEAVPERGGSDSSSGVPKDPGQPQKRKPRRGSPTWTAALAVGAVLIVILVLIVIFQRIGREEGGASAATEAFVGVATRPGGATVDINGVAAGKTPIVAYRVPAGLVRISIQREGYVSFDTALTLAAGSEEWMVTDLVQIVTPVPRGRLEVFSEPSGASVVLGRTSVGTTPLVLDSIPVGSYAVRLTKPGYRTWSDQGVQISEGSAARTRATLTPANGATLVLQALPGGIATVDGRQYTIGSGLPVELEGPPGRKIIRFSHPEYGSLDTVASIGQGERVELTCHFMGTVTIQTLNEQGNPTWGMITIDGLTTDEVTPKEFTLGPGSYTIGINRKGYESREGTTLVTIAPTLDAGRTRFPLVFHLRREGDGAR